MKTVQVDYAKGFHILLEDAHSQAGTLVIEPGKKVGGAKNRHRGADQWIYVESGEGEAEVAGVKLAMRKGTLILVQRGDAHGLRCTGEEALRILTFYVPPAYDQDCNELPAGMP